MWEVITDPFPKSNFLSISKLEFGEYISNFVPHTIVDVITYPW